MDGNPSWQAQMRDLLAASAKAWIDHRGASKGAALAFYTLFSMTPILVLAVAVTGWFFGTDTAQDEILARVRELAGPRGAQAVQALLAAAHNRSSGLAATITAGVLFLLGTTSVFVELKDSLDELWGPEHLRHTGIVGLLRTQLLAFALVLVFAGLLLASLAASAALAVAERYAGGFWSIAAPGLSLLSSLVSFGAITCLIAVIYKMLPDARLSWRDVWIGTLFTAALFTLGKYGIGLYLRKSGVASPFGAAGSVIVLLLWVYYSAQIFFLGAEFTRQYALRYGSQRRDALSPAPAPSP
jgi:membrane protein